LTVDTIQVKENLYIGDYNPADQDKQNALTAEALQKLQAQIISPTQEIFVDQKNGDDNNDGTSWERAVRFIDKALTLIKPYTSTVNINLMTYTESENEIYNTYTVSQPIDITNKYHVNTFAFTGYWKPYKTNDINAKIIVPYGKKSTGQYDFSTGSAVEKFVWGNILFSSGVNVQLNQVIPVFPNDTQINSDYLNAVFSSITTSARIYEGRSNTIQLPTNTYIFNCYLGSSFDNLFFYLENVQGEGFITKWGYPAFYLEDPKQNPEAKRFDGTSGNEQIFIINKYLSSGSTFGSTVLGSTNGIDKNIEVIFSTIS